MRQLLYISTIHPNHAGRPDPEAILRTSRQRNAEVDVTGLLFFDGKRFLQALEGEESVVEDTFARIREDGRHRAIVVLTRRAIEIREFGSWAMAFHQPGQDRAENIRVLEGMIAGAEPSVRATFAGLAGLNRAA